MADRRAEGDFRLLEGGEKLAISIDRVQRGGDKFSPQTIEDARALLAPQFAAMDVSIRALPDALRADRIVFEATLLPNYLANSYFPEGLFNYLDLQFIGTRHATGVHKTRRRIREETPTKRLILAGTDAALDQLGSLIAGAALTRTAVRASEALAEFSELRLPDVSEVLRRPAEWEGISVLEPWEAVLHPLDALRVTVGRDVFEKWISYVASLQGLVRGDLRRDIGGLTFVPVYLPPNSAEAAARFNPLRALRRLPTIRPIPTVGLRGVGVAAPLPPTEGHPKTNARIAVIDGGIDAASPYLARFATRYDRTSEPPDVNAELHGSMVTAGCLFGNITPGGTLPQPDVYVDHYRVLPVTTADFTPELYWILDEVAEIARSGQYRIINLSLGPELSADDDEPDRWTAELDTLAYEHGVLFNVAVGNDGDTATPRVMVPSDAVNALGVGSATAHAPQPRWTRAPYSCTGPGRAGGRIRPSVVSFGGTTGNEFLGVDRNGQMLQAEGTSFATPLVTHALAGVLADLGDQRATANVLRAFAAHFTERARPHRYPEVGYGRLPGRLDADMVGTRNAATVMYEGTFSRGQAVALPLPIPRGLRPDAKLNVRWTLALTAPVDPKDPVEYTQVGVELTYRPNASVRYFTRPGAAPRLVNTAIDRQEAQALMAQGWAPSEHPAAKTPTGGDRSEYILREEGKWDTLRQARLRAFARDLDGPRLDLNYVARDEGRLATGTPDLPYCLVVTVTAPPDIDLFDAVLTEFPVLTRVPLRLRVLVPGR